MERAEASVMSGAGAQARERLDELEREMGVRTKDGLIRIPTETDLKKLRGFFSDKRGDYAEAARVYNQAQAKSHSLFNDALAKAETSYGLTPNKVIGPITNGPPRDRGKQIFWSPRFGEPRLLSKPGEPFKFESTEDIQDLPSFIDAGGRPVFRISAFRNAAGRFDAGMLASYVRHEQIHHILFQEDPSVLNLRNAPSIEKQLLIKVMGEQDIYQLDYGVDWTKLFYEAAGQAYLQEQWQLRMWQGYDPYDPTDFAQQFSSVQLPDARKDEIRRAADKDLSLFARLDGLLDSGQTTTALERVRAEGASDFLRDLGDGKILELIRGWKNVRQRESEKGRIQQELAFEKLLHALRYEAGLCGFESLNKHNSRGYGFQQQTPPCSGCSKDEYYYTAPTRLPAAKAAFMLTRACYAVGLASPCNDSLPAMQAHWDENDFRNSLVLDGSGGSQRTCVLHLRESLKPPFSAQDIDRAVKRFKNEQAKEGRRLAEENYRRERDEARRRHREEGRGSPPAGGGDPGWRQPCPNLDCVPAVPW